MIVAIDGPVAAGKGTLARAIAKLFNFAYLDTGDLYRAVALKVLTSADDRPLEQKASEISASLDLLFISPAELRGEDTGMMASRIAKIPSVRANLLILQRGFAYMPHPKKAGAVLDGRDIGTVICPDADVKVFVTATPEERAKRRFAEIQAKGQPACFDQILADVKARDAQDESRREAPLVMAEDASLLDTTNLTVETALLRIVDLILQRPGVVNWP